MKLPTSFCQLPLLFDTERLIAEALQFDESEWLPHPQGHRGNTALPLVSVDGNPANPSPAGAMQATSYLERCPYITQVLATLDAPIGRTRLMRISGHEQATPHVDTNYYWAGRVRVHVPIVTFVGVKFLCGSETVHMRAGETWIFDTWRPHNVINPDDRARIHLVADTVGSASFWQRVQAARDGARPEHALAPRSGRAPFATERHNFPIVMTPWEMAALANNVLQEARAAVGAESADVGRLAAWVERTIWQWQALWARHGTEAAGFAEYDAALSERRRALTELRDLVQLSNKIDAASALEAWIIDAARPPSLTQRPAAVASPSQSPPASDSAAPSTRRGGIVDPVFIVAAPRSGSSLLFETLARAANVHTIGGESHGIIEGIAELRIEARDHASNRLLATDATPDVAARLREAFAAALRDRNGVAPGLDQPVRFLEKTPKNALRIPFLLQVFPDARFIYLHRGAPQNIASIIDAWTSRKFVTYGSLPGWSGPPWSLLLIPEWRELRGKSLAEIAVAQWESANRHILDDLQAVPSARVAAVRYEDFLRDPQGQVERLCEFAGFTWDQSLDGPLPLSQHTLTPPSADKWRKHMPDIQPHLAGIDATARRAQDLSNGPGGATADELAARENARQPPRSVHTTSMPMLLRELGMSLFVSTYQAGKLVILRPEGDTLNTHFRAFRKPMGMALRNHRLAIGTQFEVHEYRNVPAVSRRLHPPDKHDACFLPRTTHTTGDIQIHEIAWSGDELWCVNTSFSCLCTLNPDYSFVPRWRPRFISALAPEDRCHLNGLALVEGRPRFASALGHSDEPRGWRADRGKGGIVMDVSNNEIVARGLCMPHSPRWHDGKLWVLNSGEGGLGVVDLDSGRYSEVVRLPGFTRGLDFYGHFAFVGLSQIRESSTFNGFPIAQMPVRDRMCGVYVIDLRAAKPVAFVRFEAGVQEIFAVQGAQGIRFPDLVNDDIDLVSSSFVLPDDALEAVPKSLRA